MAAQAKMEETVNTPAPHEFETKVEFETRFQANPSVKRLYPLLFKRRAAAERRWEKAKGDSLVSIKTGAAEVLLFGRLD